MATGYSPKIVTDGLVLCLDAANTKSYPGTGTNWKDLSGNGNDGTLVNGVGYSSSNGGGMLFDGSNDYIRVESSDLAVGTENFTVQLICYRNSSTANLYSGAFSTAYVDSNVGIVVSDRTCWIGRGTSLQHGLLNNDTKTFEDNEWFSTSFIRSNEGKTLSLKINGIERTPSVSISNPAFIDSTILHIGMRYNDNESFGWGGFISNVKFYNRALTSTEIQQNYNATKGRFGL